MSMSDSKSIVSFWRRAIAQGKRGGSWNKAGDNSSLRHLSLPSTPEREPRAGASAAMLPLVELLCCPGCSTFLHQPISLPCGHCLCLPCLAALRKNKARKMPPGPSDDAPTTAELSAQCPRCQANYPLLPGEAWSFPANVLLAQLAQRLLDAHPELRRLQEHARHRGLRSRSASASCPLPVSVGPRPAPCELCFKRRPAQTYCATCRLHYCAKCLLKLHGNPAYRAHTLAEPAEEEGRELCPAHPERSLTHFCQSDGALGCHDCMAQPDCTHHGHVVAPLSEARASTENMLRQALEHASMVQQQCDSECEQMEALSAHVCSGSADLCRTIRQGFLSLRNALLDREASLLSQLDTLSSSSGGVAQAFLQRAGPPQSSLSGLAGLGERALLEPRASVFLQGAAGLARWLAALSAEVPRPDIHLLPAGHQPFAGAELHFDQLLSDLLGLMAKHLRWGVTDTVAMPTAIAREMIGEEAGKEEEEKEEEEEDQEEDAEQDGRGEEVDVMPRQGTPSLGSGDEEDSLELEEKLRMPAGDRARDAKAMLLPRPPIIYQHNVYSNAVEVFWMVPLGEEVHSFDLHFQDASVGVASGRGVVMGGVKGCSLQTSGLRHDTQYLFRARSVNALGHGAWSTAYRVNTGSLEEGQDFTPAQEV